MEGEDGLLYQIKGNQRGSHPETGGSNTMSGEPPRPRTFSRSSKKSARKSVLTGAELKKILQHLGVSQRTFALHSGVNEVTINKFAGGKSDGDIPLWVEWFLWIYDELPWTRRVRWRHKLPLRRWGIERDDPDSEAQDQDDVMERARTLPSELGSWTRARMVRRLERGFHDILNDPDASPRSKQIAAHAIQDLRRHATVIDYDISERTQRHKAEEEEDPPHDLDGS